MHWVHYILVIGSAFLAGIINSVAGGGTVLTFPALLAAGLPPITANGTSTIALVPGSIAAAFGFRKQVKESKALIIKLLLVNVVGGALGAILVLRIGDALFSKLAPWLILGATCLFILQEPLSKALKARAESNGADTQDETTPQNISTFKVMFWQFLFAIYGGFFGAGNGILILTALGFLGLKNIHTMNGIKNVNQVAINVVATIAFIIGRRIDWPIAAMMATSAILGAYGGAGIALKIGQKRVRQAVIWIGFGIAAILFYQQIGKAILGI
jgi:uncharacterized membrane protein YfcA